MFFLRLHETRDHPVDTPLLEGLPTGWGYGSFVSVWNLESQIGLSEVSSAQHFEVRVSHKEPLINVYVCIHMCIQISVYRKSVFGRPNVFPYWGAVERKRYYGACETCTTSIKRAQLL